MYKIVHFYITFFVHSYITINTKELSEISGMTYNECLKVIEKCRSIMQEKRYYVPESRPKMALFRIVSEYLGLIDDSKTVKENGLIY